MAERKYLLTLKLSFDSFDDMQARIRVKDFLRETYFRDNVKVKLQEVFDFQEPRKVEL